MSKLDELKQFTDKVKRDAAGRWDRILWHLAPEIQDAFKHGRTTHIKCPFHGGEDDFRPAIGGKLGNAYSETGKCICSCGVHDGWEVLMQFRGWSFSRAVDEVSNHLNGKGFQPTKPFVAYPERPKETPEQRKARDERLKNNMQSWWSKAVDLDEPEAAPARKYFKQRKLGEVLLPLPEVRLHPDLPYYQGTEKVGSWPCLLAVIRSPDGRVATLHRTWITEEGKKVDLKAARKQYSTLDSVSNDGAAIRLDDVEGTPVLHLAEGMETALAARAITRQPTWSTVNAGMLAKVEVPTSVRIVVIWADLDRSETGQKKAHELAERLASQGVAAMVFLPPVALPEGVKTVDWNDVVATIGLDSARNHFQVLRVMRWVNEQLGRINVRPENVAIA